MQRSELRKQLRLARQQLTRAQQDKAAEAVLQRLCDLPLLSHATYAACYLPNDGEVSLTPFIKHCWQSKATSHPMRCNTTLPVLHPVCKGHLLFLGYDAQTHMVKNTFAIPEPELACQNIVP
ncbi:MAG TPA: 5-formyltetrahydrofolate cyclo-ligase, partial [Alteromonas australica]|nr:5-formyltetrahydrofolate cyclo-ligase [Alteromonas australica]